MSLRRAIAYARVAFGSWELEVGRLDKSSVNVTIALIAD
jgi:hypothetical protein